MILITKESAFKTFYYLIASDGKIASEEMVKLDEIGIQLFGESFQEFREVLISECQRKTASVSGDPDEDFDLIAECVDEALSDTTENVEKGIPSRMMVWNLLLIVHSDGSFDQCEKRLMRKASAPFRQLIRNWIGFLNPWNHTKSSAQLWMIWRTA